MPDLWKLAWDRPRLLFLATCIAAVVGAIIESAYVATSGVRAPFAWWALPGAIVALLTFRLRGIRRPWVLASAVGAGLIATGIWACLTSAHANRWAAVLDALVCPIAGAAIGLVGDRSPTGYRPMVFGPDGVVDHDDG